MFSRYDVVIVGAGVAGLRVGIETLRMKPGISCCILEKYRYHGGRVVTYKKNISGIGSVQWENGAGRIASSHHRVLSLFKQYHLSFVPIESDSMFLSKAGYRPNPFSELYEIYIKPLESLSLTVLQTHTIYQLLEQTVGPKVAKDVCVTFPYFSEMYTLRADCALESFRSEMGSSASFGVCGEGLSSLVEGMVNEFESLGGKLISQIEVTSIDYHSGVFSLHSKQICDGITKKTTIQCSTCVLALHSHAVKQIRGVNHLPVLSKLMMMPLLRMYAIFPTIGGKSWFSNLRKTVTDDPIRYIIPTGKRTIMISYTDGKDASYWFRQGNVTKVEQHVMKHIRRLFPDRTIPDPLFFKMHPWYQGCTYWLPGSYSVEEESYASLQPLKKTMPNLFMCGESFAVKQCWIESALDQADQLLGLAAFKDSIK